ncbi:hypothetical protein NPIL_270471, partial [Nephila pilipes]
RLKRSKNGFAALSRYSICSNASRHAQIGMACFAWFATSSSGCCFFAVASIESSPESFLFPMEWACSASWTSVA